MTQLVSNSGTTAASGLCSSSGCPTSSSSNRGADRLAHLPEAIRARIHNHPCFSEEAHHHYARMHVAVAPACNIQCHYCNRKYDCSNESRPGVVSELLTPEQAIQKTLAVAAAIPQMSVLGIAGPGDPLANPERTLATFRGLSEKAPDIKLCLSTNGLALPGLVDEICRHNIEHVTITINCVDPEIGARIYPWIFWNNRRITGIKAARILIEQQQKGLEMLVERGVLVKINSVLIPGVNDRHLREVSRVVKAKGAFLHNLMPLIAEPEHGTFFGLMGQRSPTAAELQTLQNDCADGMAVMRHCRQCRADAVGMLGEDRCAEFTLDKIGAMEIDHDAAMQRRAETRAAIEAKRLAPPSATLVPIVTLMRRPSSATRTIRVAVASSDGQTINQHFGHAEEFFIYTADGASVRHIDTVRVGSYCSGPADCGEQSFILDDTIQALDGCAAVLCARIGIDIWGRLEAAGIMPNGEHAQERIEEAIAAVYPELTASRRLNQSDATPTRQVRHGGTR